MSLFRALLKKSDPPVYEFYFTITVSDNGTGGWYSHIIGFSRDIGNGGYGNISQNPFFVKKDLYFYIDSMYTHVSTNTLLESRVIFTFNRDSALFNRLLTKLTRLDNGFTMSSNGIHSTDSRHFALYDTTNRLFNWSTDLNKTISFKLEFIKQ